MQIHIDAEIRKILTTTPPGFSRTDAESIAKDTFGISAQASLLVSERDQNFRLDAEDGKRYTLKIANHAEQAEVVDFQNRALQHIAGQDASIPVPRVIANLNGQFYCSKELDGRVHLLRVLSWMDGQGLHEITPGPLLLSRMGSLLARLGIALKDFNHPGSNPPLLWDMKRAAELRGLLPCIEDADLKGLIESALDRFDLVKPVLDTLRSQVIHNDLNEGNVLLDKTDTQQISAIIDFGDLVKSPLIIDLAVASAYYLAAGDDPLAGALPLITAYHRVRPLQTEEMEILTDLIRTRLVTSLLICSWRISKFPENREYLQISETSSKASLTSLNKEYAKTAFDRIRTACGTV